MSKNKEIAEIFSKMADIMEFLGENPYRINTYRRVAEVLSELGMDVEELVKTGKIYQIPGIGESSVSKILEYLRTGKISKYEELKKQVPEDLLELLDVPGIGPKTLRLGYEKLNVRTKDDFLRAVSSALQYFTGSKEHNVRIRDIAKAKGLKLSEYGVFRADTEEWLGGRTEEEVYELLGMDCPPPELRENVGEVELALERKLPRLVEWEDIKGDFHMHTNWSDGLGSIEEMAETAYRLGLQYIVIGDHSPSARVAKGLDIQRYREQWKVIERLNSYYNKKGFYILRGCEVDILPDGSLDLPNEFLEEFDFVVASIHTRFGQDNTYRILRAIENPFVNLIGHPTGKAYGSREGYPLNMEQIINLAKETGTALELNTFRADLSPEMVRKCVEKGALVAIVTDAHAPSHIRYLKIGVGLARRGWAKKEDILNTRTVEEIKEFVRRKRYKVYPVLVCYLYSLLLAFYPFS
jgi:histidinol phosphatase-like PHP family hydrolase